MNNKKDFSVLYRNLIKTASMEKNNSLRNILKYFICKFFF